MDSQLGEKDWDADGDEQEDVKAKQEAGAGRTEEQHVERPVQGQAHQQPDGEPAAPDEGALQPNLGSQGWDAPVESPLTAGAEQVAQPAGGGDQQESNGQAPPTGEDIEVSSLLPQRRQYASDDEDEGGTGKQDKGSRVSEAPSQKQQEAPGAHVSLGTKGWADEEEEEELAGASEQQTAAAEPALQAGSGESGWGQPEQPDIPAAEGFDGEGHSEGVFGERLDQGLGRAGRRGRGRGRGAGRGGGESRRHGFWAHDERDEVDEIEMQAMLEER